MTPKGKMKSYTGCVWSLVLFIALVVMVLMFGSVLSGCKHVEYVTVPEYHTDTLYQNHIQRDSVWLHDSIHIKEWGDSVLIYKYQTKYIERLRTDTIYKARVDSVPVPYPVEKIVKVEKELKWWQKMSMSMGWIMIAMVLIWVGFGVFKLVQKFR